MDATLKFIRREYIEVDYGDLEKFIELVYGQEFSLPMDWEIGNDTSINFDVRKEPVDSADLESLHEFRQSGAHQFLLATILQDLCYRDLIIEGHYLIQVCW